MDKVFTRLFLLVFFWVCFCAGLRAQTITIRNFDAGTYGSGSTISVPFNLGDDVIFNRNYRYQLFLSNASGVYPVNPIATSPDFYATYLNGIIPAGTPAGSGYRLKVVVIPDVNNPGGPAVASAETAQFTISGSSGVTARMTAPEVVRAPDILGLCSAQKNGSYTFTNASSGGSAATTLIYNELTRAVVTSPDNQLDPTVVFNASEANYTITVRAVNNGVIGTYSYTLFNRPYYKSFGSAGTSTVCLSGGGDLTYNVDIGSTTGLHTNYPGLLYNITWGDGSTSTLTIAEIKSAAGRITHTYTSSSCGRTVNNQRNVFKVDLTIIGLICDPRLTPTTEYAKVLEAPVNKIEETSPKVGCVGEEITILNDSFTGQDPNSNVASCVNRDATYTWLVDDVITYTGYAKSRPFAHTFASAGEHKVTLRIENTDPNFCTSDDVDWFICIKERPIANFTVNGTTCVGNAVTPNSSGSVTDNVTTCTETVNYVYNWTVTPTAGRTLTGGNTPNPTILFNQPGVYTVNMSITGGCTVNATPRTIRVEAQPTAALSPDVTLCGIGIARTFNESAGPLQTTITGTPENESPNYEWDVQGGAFQFVAPSTRNSRYPTIIFNDEAVYTVRVKHKNGCDANDDYDAEQVITIRNAPVPITGTYTPACADAPIQLTAQTSTNAGVTGIVWTGAGTFSNRNIANPTYRPTIAERDAGLAKVFFTVQTTITGCENIESDTISLVIRPLNRITSDSSKTICNDTRINYRPSAANGSTFRWSVASAPLTAEIVPGPTGGAEITDLIRNNDPTGQDIEVVYTIVPTVNGCDGEPFPFTAIVTPRTITADFTISSSGPYCGSTPLTFEAVSQSASSIFNWTVSDGTTGNGTSFNHTFLPVDDGSGTEKVYTVTLTIGNSCAVQPPTRTITVTIHPERPIAIINATPDGTCGEVDITVQNQSPGNNRSYVFSLLDENNSPIQSSPVITTKSDYIFPNVQPPVTGARSVKVRLDVIGSCGATSFIESTPIVLSASVLVSNMSVDKSKVCLGDPVTFINNSTGTSFVYNIYRENETTSLTSIPANNRDDIPYEFAAPGRYEVTITPSSGCGSAAESLRRLIVVHDIPTTEFTEAVVNCDNLTYQFTVDGIVNPGYSYTWNFGDGTSVTNPTPPPHTYAASGIYDVTLTVANITQGGLSCSSTSAPKQITVRPPLVANFLVLPSDTIQIPNYHFSFRDQSTGGAVSWDWNFNSVTVQPQTVQNPEVTYSMLDTGYHNVTLTVRDNQGCAQSITKRIKITGSFGHLYVPNAFVPTSINSAVNTFIAKGRGLQTWKMEIYNKWGQLMWRTDKLTSDGEPMEGWDGNYQGSPAPQGAYVWQITAKFKNGTDWKGMSYNNSPPKRMGVINLIR
ncbi:hypothetical protein DJ568_04275 [Mucilaginibacter hurinus]|uniref:PKD domain-containing protein n=1 Tax=Mucilaginibacter hurinus TaxID=2201324 RepID=A0A367GR84_9SPHI|nr:PKD domain-containing protein [Mucilaginibacter hurinus]RCH55974.1 hypothetical protein DJ568_04275 [Mucilaginibacter hurinus]